MLKSDKAWNFSQAEFTGLVQADAGKFGWVVPISFFLNKIFQFQHSGWAQLPLIIKS